MKFRCLLQNKRTRMYEMSPDEIGSENTAFHEPGKLRSLLGLIGCSFQEVLLVPDAQFAHDSRLRPHLVRICRVGSGTIEHCFQETAGRRLRARPIHETLDVCKRLVRGPLRTKRASANAMFEADSRLCLRTKLGLVKALVASPGP